MTGYYRVNIPPDRAWHRIVFLCRSLHSEGLHYNVALNLAPSLWGEADCPHVLITAAGKGKVKRQAMTHAHAFHLPAPISVEYARKKAEHAERYGDNEDHEYWRELELLSGQRAHYKPGLSDATRTDDDEVAA